MALITYIDMAENLLDRVNAIGTTILAVVDQDQKIRVAQVLKSFDENDHPNINKRYFDSFAW